MDLARNAPIWRPCRARKADYEVATRARPWPENKRKQRDIALEEARRICSSLIPEAEAIITEAKKDRQRYGLPPATWMDRAEAVVYKTAYSASIIESQMVQARLEDTP
jgi:hypothetical protein